MTSQLLTTFKQQISSLELAPGGGGRFEITLDGDLVYSKLETGEFPDEDEILRLVRQRLS